MTVTGLPRFRRFPRRVAAVALAVAVAYVGIWVILAQAAAAPVEKCTGNPTNGVEGCQIAQHITSVPSDVPNLRSAAVSTGDTCNGRIQFIDNFDGTAIDRSKWMTGFYWGPQHPNQHREVPEQQTYVTDLEDPVFRVSDGTLKIVPRMTGDGYYSGALTALEYDPEDSGEREHYSPNLETVGRAEPFGRGCYEIRAKFPDQPKAFAAFWLISNHGPEFEDGASPELDVIETLGEPHSIYATAHGLHNGASSIRTPNHEPHRIEVDDEFHTFSARWADTELIWYVDGEPIYRYPDYLPWTNDMFLHLNYALGGAWSQSHWGGPVDDSFFSTTPAALEVDYVLVTD